MKESIKFSILIPSYKGKYLIDALDSCVNQTYNNYEVIIVDDSSPEDLHALVLPYLNDSRYSYYRNSHNIGAVNLVDNWNVCLSYAIGDYVICMGDDDRLLPCCLQEYNKLITIFPNLGIYHGWTQVINENGSITTLQEPRPLYEGVYSFIWNRWNYRKRQYIGDFCYDIKLLRANNGFVKFPMAWGSDDVTAVLAASAKGIANTSVPVFQYRDSNMTISSVGALEIKVDAVTKEKEWYLSFLANNDIAINDIEKVYRGLIVSQIELHFLQKYKTHIYVDVCTNLYRIFHWIKCRKNFGISLGQLVWIFVNAIHFKIINKK